MMRITVSKSDVAKMRKRLSRLEYRPAIKLVKKANRAGLAPVMKAAKRNVPTRSGALKKSLGIQNNKRVKGGRVISKVWPRPRFKSKGLNDNAPIDISERRSGHPRTYAKYIEVGMTANGRRIRKAGPANYLEKAYKSENINAVQAFSKRFWVEIEKTLKQGGRK